MYDIFGKYGAIRQIRTYVAVLFTARAGPPGLSEHSRARWARARAKAPAHSGTAQDTRGTAFVVYEDIYDAKNACEHLSGFNVLGRYLIVLYYQPNKVTKKVSLQKKQEELEALKQKYGVTEEDLKR